VPIRRGDLIGVMAGMIENSNSRGRSGTQVMNPLDSIRAVPRLSQKNVMTNTSTCKICGHKSPFFDVVDFNKFAASDYNYYSFGPSGTYLSYFRCGECEFLFTPFFDHWSSDDFKAFIYNDDYIAVDGEYATIRPQGVANHMISILAGYQTARILDFGSGTGTFAQVMKAAGFDVTSYDPFSMPERPSGLFDIVTCFEVLEHIPFPLEGLAGIQSFLTKKGCIILSQALQPDNIQQLRCSWWYVAPRNGHMSIYSEHTLAELARRADMVFHKGKSFHVLRPQGCDAVDLLSQIGPAFFSLTLKAPRESSAVGWHGLEGPVGARFRWTCKTDLTWIVTIPLGVAPVLQLRFPFAMEIRPRFATECVVHVGGHRAEVAIRGSAIVAITKPVLPGSHEVTLSTPAPLSPAALRGAKDDRVLGLAVPVLEASD
jgi:SAM-dependent methyltransferase